MDSVDMVWHPAPGHETEVVTVLRSEGAQIRSGLGFEPLTTIVVALGLSSLVGALIKLYRDARYKGVLIDATAKPIVVREMPGWSRRQVLVITKEGAQFHDVDEGEPSADALGKIAQFLGK
jgi:hypothetical protein